MSEYFVFYFFDVKDERTPKAPREDVGNRRTNGKFIMSFD